MREARLWRPEAGVFSFSKSLDNRRLKNLHKLVTNNAQCTFLVALFNHLRIYRIYSPPEFKISQFLTDLLKSLSREREREFIARGRDAGPEPSWGRLSTILQDSASEKDR